MSDLPLEHGLFGRLRRDAGAAWEGYVAHPFVVALGEGTLPEAAFRHYLIQDYLFLIHFARAYALAGTRARTWRICGRRRLRFPTSWTWRCRCMWATAPDGG